MNKQLPYLWDKPRDIRDDLIDLAGVLFILGGTVLLVVWGDWLTSSLINLT